MSNNVEVLAPPRQIWAWRVAYRENMAHKAIFVCSLRFAHFEPKALKFWGFSLIIKSRRLRKVLFNTGGAPRRHWWKSPGFWWCGHQYLIRTTRYSNVRYVLLILDPKCMVKCMVKCMDWEIYKGIRPAQKLWYSNGKCNHMNAGANYILASYMSLFGPFSPHAPLLYVTKTRFFSNVVEYL